MAIGLTYRQLLRAFTEALDKRNLELDAELLRGETEVHPLTKQFLDTYCKKYPELSEKQAMAYVGLVKAMLDTIVLNNKAIAKAISSPEVYEE